MDCKARLSLRCTETDRQEIQAMVGELRRLRALLKGYRCRVEPDQEASHNFEQYTDNGIYFHR